MNAAPDFVDVASTSQLNFIGSYGSTFAAIVDPNLQMMQRNMGNGAAVGDYDGDGDLDVYLLGQLGLSNKLFRNNYNGGAGSKTFTDVTATAGVDNLGHSRVAHFADLDGDGLLDLLVINDDDGGNTYAPSAIYRNDGEGLFSDVTSGSGFRPTGYLRAGCALADYDGDGLLDIYVTNWGLYEYIGPAEFPGSNRLYRNLGDFVFEDATVEAGLGTLGRDSFSAIFADFDGDDDPDLHVAVDHTSDEFYWNNGGIFTLATMSVGATHTGNDMGVAVGDFDQDGDLDLYATNITDPSGNFGITQYNVFYVNQFDQTGTTTFVDEAVARGVEDTYWGWGTQFVDVDNDGDLDIVAVTGFDEFVLFGGPEGAASAVYQTPSVLRLNDGTGNYGAAVTGTGLDATDDSRGLVAFDYDRDGDMDLLVTNVDQPVRLFENVSTGDGNWLGVRLRPHASAIGATVYATSGGTTRRRDVIAGRSYLAGTPSEVHFGLGSTTLLDTLLVHWPDGSEQVLADVAVNQLLTITKFEGESVPGLLPIAQLGAVLTIGAAGIHILFARRRNVN